MRRKNLFFLLGFALALLGLLAVRSTASASPAAPIDHTLTQPDGSTFSARQWGDETLHGYETLDGYTILQDPATGYWVYAARDAAGQLVAACAPGPVGCQPMIVGQSVPAAQSASVRPSRPQPLPPVMVPDEPRLAPDAAELAPQRAPMLGNQYLLVILVRFANQNFTFTRADFDPVIFGSSNSVRDFYADASFGDLVLTRAPEAQGIGDNGFVEIALPYNHPNRATAGMARDAITAANAYVNFAALDTDGDGAVSTKELHILLITAGEDRTFCGTTCTAPAVWAETFQTSGLTLDGKTVGQTSNDGDYGAYVVLGERHGSRITSIGPIVHELGHSLTFPSLFDPDASSAGVGDWSVMGSGAWNGITYPGDSPAMPDAFLKWYAGWISPITARSGQTYNLGRGSTNPDALLVGRNPQRVDWNYMGWPGNGEYFLVENRQRNGYDAALPGCGLLIWHIDEDRSHLGNANADEARPLVGLVQADGLNQLQANLNQGDAGDPFPGTANRTRFDDASTPSSRRYSGLPSNTHLRITSAACAETMTLVNEAPPQSHSVFLPVLQSYVEYTGRVTMNGAPAANELIVLSACDGPVNCVRYSTRTDATGFYRFDAPPVGHGKWFSVYYPNFTDAQFTGSKVWIWNCPELHGNSSDRYSCSFDIAKPVFTQPNSSACVSGTLQLPYVFRWNARPIPSDNYRIGLCDSATCYITGPLGYTNQWTMTTRYDGMPANTAMLLKMWIHSSAGMGVGLANYCGNVTVRDP